MIRLLASDLDGTLVRSDGTISERSVSALKDADRAGLVIVFVTGRPPRWLHEVVDATGQTGIAVSANGAVLYDMRTDTVLAEYALQPEELKSITAELRSAFPDVTFAVDYGDSFASEPTYVHDWVINPPSGRVADPVVADLDQIVVKPAIKLLAKDTVIDPDVFRVEATRLLGDRASVTSSSRFGLLEIAVPGVSKATGLAEVAARHGIGPDEIAAVGDMPNDVPMLEWVGHSYAVANAHPAAIAAAQTVLPSNDDDAVAQLIESILAEQPL